MRPFTPSGAMPGYGDSFSRGMPINGPQFRSESRSSTPGVYHRLGDQFGSNFNFMQHQHGQSDQHRSTYQTRGDQDADDLEYCRPRGSTIGDFDQDNFQSHRRRSSIPENRMHGYGDPYGMGPMSVSPREHMMRAQMMRGSLYGMDPMMGHMGLGSGYGGSRYGGGMGGYDMGVRPSILGPGSSYGYGPRPMMGMGGIMGTGYGGGGMRPYRMSGFVDTYSPHLMRAKTWSAYGRML